MNQKNKSADKDRSKPTDAAPPDAPHRPGPAIHVQPPDFPPPPPNDDALHRWIRETLDVDLPRQAVIQDAASSSPHAAPFDYLRWVFFDAAAPSPHDGVADAVVWANRGGGKTFLGALATVLDLVFRPGIEVRILAGSLEQAQRMHAHLRRFFAAPDLAGYVDGRITDRRIRLKNHAAVELLAQSQTAVRGTRVQRLRCDEVELFDPDVWDAAQLTTRSKQCGDFWVAGSVECLSTMHLPHGLMHRLVADAREGRRRLFKWGVVDVLAQCGDERSCGADDPASPRERRCPLWNECGGRAKTRPGNALGAAVGHMDIRDVIRMKARVSQPVWESEMLCLRPRRDDSVLPEFIAGTHVVDSVPGVDAPDPSRRLRWIGGMDFGFRSPTIVLWAALDEEDRLWVVDELERTRRTVAENAAEIAARGRPDLLWIGVDPAGAAHNDQTGRSSVEVLRRAGFSVRLARLPVAVGLELVRARLRPAEGAAGPRLFIHARCARLIESLERYHYPKDPERAEPVKDGHDHAVDALRYMIQNLDRPAVARVSNYMEGTLGLSASGRSGA